MPTFFTQPSEKSAGEKRKRSVGPHAPKKRFAAGEGQTRGGGVKRAGKPEKSGASKSKKWTRGGDDDDGPRRRKKSDDDDGPRRRKKSDDDDGPRRRKKSDDDDDSSISGSDSEDGDNDKRGRDEADAVSDADSDSGAEGADGQPETAAERRLRLAERYLENVRQDVDEVYGFDAEEIDRDLIAERLQEDVAETKGRVYRRLADELQVERASHCLVRWNARNVNAVAVCAPFAYTVAHDGSLIKWRIQDRPEEQQRQRAEAQRQRDAKKRRKGKGKASKGGLAASGEREQEAPAGEREKEKHIVPPRKRPEKLLVRRAEPRRRNDKDFQGHVGAVLCVAASQDGRFVVTGGADRRVVVYDAATLAVLRMFSRHRGPVTSLAFRRGSNQLYSGSRDRTVNIYSLDELAYVQTLFGHLGPVTAIDALARDRFASVGAEDRVVRLWKVVEEQQFAFKDDRPPRSARDPAARAVVESSVDCVAMLDDELFVTGSDIGSLTLWSTQRKKPLFVVPRAHGTDPPRVAGREQYDRAYADDPAFAAANPPPPPLPRWITALRAIPYSDVLLSGSWDGSVRVWRLSEDKRRLEAVGVLGGAAANEGEEDGGGDDKMAVASHNDGSSEKTSGLRGVVNDIAVFERGERGRDGLSVAVAVGQQHRLGRWGQTDSSGRNGLMIFEVKRHLDRKAAAA